MTGNIQNSCHFFVRIEGLREARSLHAAVSFLRYASIASKFSRARKISEMHQMPASATTV